DMIIHGENSLACLCEPTSDNYNPSRCNPDTYIGTVDISPSLTSEDIREYSIHIPLNYPFNGLLCDPLRFDPNYVPPFISSENFEIVRTGMRTTVVEGTGMPADLPYIQLAGKTGTAEYCDNIAGALGLCEQGNWPAHAWFAAYGP